MEQLAIISQMSGQVSRGSAGVFVRTHRCGSSKETRGLVGAQALGVTLTIPHQVEGKGGHGFCPMFKQTSLKIHPLCSVPRDQGPWQG